MTVRVAAFQREPVLDDALASSAIVADDVSWAAAEGADLAVFPEAYLDGHSYDRETIAARARALDDPAVRNLAESLRTFPVTVVVGMFERRERSIRNVALVLRAGALVGVYAKARPNEPGVEAGTDMPVFGTGGSCFAVAGTQHRQPRRPGPRDGLLGSWTERNRPWRTPSRLACGT